jgi:hypothetical protein
LRRTKLGWIRDAWSRDELRITVNNNCPFCNPERRITKKDLKRPEDLGLPDYCVGTEKIEPTMDIQGIDKALLKGERIEEAWRLIGEQSEWVIRLLDSHGEKPCSLSTR